MADSTSTRRKAAQRFEEIADTAFFRALSEPVRVRILAALIEMGKTDISSLASRFEQDRSVISRHLSLLESCGIVRCTQDGRHRFYQLDGQSILTNLNALTAQCQDIVKHCGC
jgi:DNA-binding transcriptional ArsR family regulator